MKFTIVKSKFVEGLKSVQNIILSKVTVPVLQNVRLDAAGGTLKLTSTDLDTTITCEVECEVQEPGATTLPAKILFNMVSCAAEGPVEVSVGEGECASIRAGSANYKLVGINESTFPRLPQTEGMYSYSIDQFVLKEMLRKTCYAASQDETRRTLRGLLMSFKDEKLTLVATDGRRLALVEKEMEFAKEAERDIILPSRLVQELQRSLGGEGKVSISGQGSQICFDIGKIKIYSKLIDDVYPNYTQVIPVSCQHKICVDRQQIMAALERVSVMAMGEIHSTKLKFSDNILVVTSGVSNIGEAKDEVAIKFGGPEIETIFNPAYIIDALKAIDDDEVVFHLNDGNSPVVISCSIPFIYLIMPLRVS